MQILNAVDVIEICFIPVEMNAKTINRLMLG